MFKLYCLKLKGKCILMQTHSKQKLIPSVHTSCRLKQIWECRQVRKAIVLILSGHATTRSSMLHVSTCIRNDPCICIAVVYFSRLVNQPADGFGCHGNWIDFNGASDYRCFNQKRELALTASTVYRVPMMLCCGTSFVILKVGSTHVPGFTE